ncbi:PAAR-like domain-containing protein [Marinospirillum sp.]|uniref:PAAR-like domain-containing protein n=1 Tax=Marinospirillum sp. TaxID=2183934 RepID=UPI0038620B5F
MMVFATTQMGGMNLGFPDVCLTPIPSPVGPIPYSASLSQYGDSHHGYSIPGQGADSGHAQP